jgi:hypothetical protein
MPTESTADNKAYCKAYYAKVRQDPEKLAKLRARRAENQRKRRAAVKPVVTGRQPKPVTTAPAPVTTGQEKKKWITIPPPGPPVATESAPATTGSLGKEELNQMVEERAAIMEFDGGAERMDAEQAAVREVLGGLHAAAQAQGEVSVSLESLIAEWHERWADDLMS